MICKGCASTLAQAGRNVSTEWQEAQAHWRDAKAAEFQREYLDPLPPQLARAQETLEELHRLLGKIRSECE
jgi:hypothetical protein